LSFGKPVIILGHGNNLERGLLKWLI